MTPMTDDQVMRAALADLTSEQPPMPPGRFQSVRRRAARHRRHQLTSAAVSALAVAGIAVGLARLPASLPQPPQGRHVPGWALPWPDYRNGSVPQSVLDNAVIAWGDPAKYVQGSKAPSSPREIARLLASYHVVWYAGQTVAHGQDVAVMFEATSPDTGPQLVVGVAGASEVMQGQPAWRGSTSPWGLTAIAAPARSGAFGPDISEYVTTLSASGLGTDTWIVVLPAPGERLGLWAAGRSAGAFDITGVQSAGVFVAKAGQVQSDVVLGFTGARAESAPVGIGRHAAVVPLEAPPATVPPAAFHEISGLTGQGSEPSESDLSVSATGGPYAVLGSCYNAAANSYDGARPAPGGHGRLQIIVNGHPVGSVRCDEQQHQLSIPRSALRPHGIMISAASSGLTSWRIAFGRLP